MSAVATKAQYSPEDLLALSDGERYELVDGNLVERNVSAISSDVAMELGSLLRTHCKANRPAWVLGADCGYQCFPGHTNKVRKPDVSVILRERLPLEQASRGFVTIAPDLVVEVVSPHDLAYDLEQKVQDYLDAGVKLVWVVNPPTRTAFVYRADGSIVGLRASEELDGESILPGFRCKVESLFPRPAETGTHPA